MNIWRVVTFLASQCRFKKKKCLKIFFIFSNDGFGWLQWWRWHLTSHHAIAFGCYLFDILWLLMIHHYHSSVVLLVTTFGKYIYPYSCAIFYWRSSHVSSFFFLFVFRYTLVSFCMPRLKSNQSVLEGILIKVPIHRWRHLVVSRSGGT